jgi:hypothetical protein
MFDLLFVPYLLTVRSLTFFFLIRIAPTTGNDKITLKELKELRAISEAVTESRDLHINNDWSHIITEVIGSYKTQKEFQLVSEAYFVYDQVLKSSKSSKKAEKGDDKYIDGQYALHHLIAKVLFGTQPGKEAVARHGLGPNHTVTEEGWNQTCLGQALWIGYLSTPHPVVSYRLRF